MRVLFCTFFTFAKCGPEEVATAPDRFSTARAEPFVRPNPTEGVGGRTVAGPGRVPLPESLPIPTAQIPLDEKTEKRS